MQQLEEEKLAIELGTGKVLSDTSGRFIAIIDGQTISQGIDPEGKRNRCEYETFLIQGFLQRGLELNDPKAALEFADGQIKKFYHNEIPEESLKCTKTARMDHYKYSDRATQRSSREAVRQEVLKDEKYEYTRMQEELFGENGTIKRVVQMRFPITLNNNAMKKLFSGEASKEDLEKILNKFSV
ncbi:MAG: hypothetical protein QW666_02395 [Candidatus Woesearchaeota archaeon]